MVNYRLIINKIILVLISLFSCIILFLTFKTFIALFNFQFKDFSDNPINSVEEFDNQFTPFPPINPAAIPTSAMRASLLLSEGKNSFAINELKKTSEINPYIGYGEFILANFYYLQGNIDSSYFYAERAFRLWPKSINNFDMINKVYANVGDTLSIINSYYEIKDFFSGRSEYYNSFIKYYSLGKYFYYNIDYADARPITKDQLLGEWVQVNNRLDGGIRVNLNSSMEFLSNGFFKSDNKYFLYDFNDDKVFLKFQNNSNKVISTFTVKYSDQWETLIVRFNNESEDKNKFFRKKSELKLDN